MIPNLYVVEKVPSKYLVLGAQSGVEYWYCHRKGHSECPVWGSIGTKKEAEAICRQYNLDGKVHYEGR